MSHIKNSKPANISTPLQVICNRNKARHKHLVVQGTTKPPGHNRNTKF